MEQIFGWQISPDLTGLLIVDLKNNFISSLAPLENTNIWTADLRNNPIDETNSTNASIIAKFENEGRTLKLTPYAETQIVEFTNEEFKNDLLESYDKNDDGELSVYECQWP